MKCTYPNCKCPESGCQGFGELKSIIETTKECEHKELIKKCDEYICIKCRKPYVFKINPKG